MIKFKSISVWRFNSGVVCIYALLITFFALSHDLFRDIASEADSDFTGIYNALRFNDGLPQSMFDHTGYVYFVILSIWLKVLNLFSLIPISRITDLPGPTTFEPIWSNLVYAGRSLSIVLSILSGTLFYFVTKSVCGNRNVAAIVGILFAVSPGLVRQSLVMHTELPSMVFFLSAFLFALYAGRSKPWIEFFFVFLAAFCVTLAAMSKMQIIPLILALPMVTLVINAGKMDRSVPVRFIYPLPWVAVIVILSLALSVPTQVMAWTLIFPALPELEKLSNSGYQLLIAGYLIAMIIVYNFADRRSYREILLAISVISAGMALAFYFNFLHHSVTNTAKLVNFADHMTAYVNNSVAADLGNKTDSNLISKLVIELGATFLEVLRHNFLVFNVSKWPFTLIYWVSTSSIIYLLVQRNWRLSLTIITLLFTAFGMETFSGLRHFGENYRFFYEIWILLALAILVQITLSKGLWEKAKKFKPRSMVAISIMSIILLYAFAGSVERASTTVEWHDRVFGCGQAEGYMPDLIPHFCNDNFLNPVRLK